MSHIAGEIRKFCETTSVRGIPRIFKSKENFLKILWIFAVVVCTALLIYLLITLFGKFYQFPVATRFGQDLKGDIQFPDITICSLNRFMNDFKGNPSIKDYFKMVEVFEKSYNNSEIEEYVNGQYNSISGYIMNLPRGILDENDCPNFIASCDLYLSDWETPVGCKNSFTQIWNAEYYSCHTIKTNMLNLAENNTKIRGMVLVLNIGPPYDEQIPNKISLTSSQASGVRISVHTSGTSPDFKRGFNVGPGTENVVKIVQKNIVRLDKHHGCTNQKNITGSSKVYSQDICIEDCIQKLMHQACNCVMSIFYIPDSLNGTQICGNTSFFYDDTAAFNWLECLSKNGQSFDDSCSEKCLLPCSEISYQYTVISSPWPPKFLQRGVYNDYFSDCIEDFPQVKKRYAAYYNFESYDKFANLKELDESLLQIKFVIEDNFPYSLVDKQAYPWDVMISLVGGMLSLWLGISAMTAFELIELLYLILKGFQK